MSARGEGAGQPSTSAQGQPAAPAPQKRGRGRPRKQQQEPTGEPSPKRPRGRPKGSKNKSPSKAAQKKAEATGEKRPRGRPRKWPQQVVQKKPAQTQASLFFMNCPSDSNVQPGMKILSKHTAEEVCTSKTQNVNVSEVCRRYKMPQGLIPGRVLILLLLLSCKRENGDKLGERKEDLRDEMNGIFKSREAETSKSQVETAEADCKLGSNTLRGDISEIKKVFPKQSGISKKPQMDWVGLR